MKPRNIIRPLLAGISALALASTASAASVAAISVTGASANTNNFSVGYSFSTTSTIYVTDLGVFDSNGGTLSNQTVGLYYTDTNGGALITSTAVTNASPSETNGGYTVYYAPITTLTLTAGTYFVASTTSGDGFRVGGTKTTAPGITYIKGEASAGSSTLGATYSSYSTDNTSGYFGGTFKFTTDPVPEPSAALLGGLGFLCLLRRRR